MNLVCWLFGHSPPVYAEVRVNATDGIGRVHAHVIGKCARCEQKFTVARVHLPTLGRRT